MIYFIRHGESEANVKNLFAGQKDNSELTELGEQQALVAARAIKDRGLVIDGIVASSLLRAKKTAEIISEHLGVDPAIITYDDRAMEYDMGDFTGTPLRKLTAQDRAVSHNEEDPRVFQQRVMSLLKELGIRGGNILVVSHAGVGRMIETTKQGMDPNDFYEIDPYPNATLVELVF